MAVISSRVFKLWPIRTSHPGLSYKDQKARFHLAKQIDKE
jgi:hypothetical protein